METSLRYRGDSKALRIHAKEKVPIDSNTFFQVHGELDTRVGQASSLSAQIRHFYPSLSATLGVGLRYDKHEKLCYTEGLVEIREDYIEDSHKGETKSGPLKQDAPDLEKAKPDDEYARMLSRMDELEKEELAAESGGDNGKNEQTTEDVDDISYQRPVDNEPRNSEDFHKGAPPVDQANNKSMATKSVEKHCNPDIADQLNFASLDLQSNVREGKNAAKRVKFVDHIEKPLVHHEEKQVKAATASKSEVQHQPSQPSFDSHKAFTGSIVEHTENIKTSKGQSSTSSQVSGSQPSKPVSRFKMQRR